MAGCGKCRRGGGGCKLLPGPPVVANIVVNEACERFAFYSARAILVLYFTDALAASEDQAISLYSFFMAGCYLSPLVGGYVADTYLGKYTTILVFNVVYLVGLAVLGGTAFSAKAVGAAAGLTLIAAGTGGIKPCIAPFGAEQLAECTDAERTSFFFMFYAAINAGSTLSYIITPLVRKYAGFGPAFLLSLAMVTVSLGIFLAGSRSYRRVPPAGTSAYHKVYRVVRAALARPTTTGIGRSGSEHAPLIAADDAVGSPRAAAGGTGGSSDGEVGSDAGFGGSGGGAGGGATTSGEGAAVAVTAPLVASTSSSQAVDDAAASKRVMVWLRPALGRVPREDVEGATAVLRILPLFLMLPVFWSLQDAQGSIWTLQRKHMDNCLGSGVCFTPEQLGALNPIFVLILVPIFDKFLMPALRATGRPWAYPTALRRMTLGMQLAASAFIATWMVQRAIDDGAENSVSSFWQVPQIFIITVAEVMVSATGLEWAYSQAPPSMRSTIVALYHAMVAAGDLLTGALYRGLSASLSQAQILLVLAGLMCIAGVMFGILAYRYHPNNGAGTVPTPAPAHAPAPAVADGHSYRDAVRLDATSRSVVGIELEPEHEHEALHD